MSVTENTIQEIVTSVGRGHASTAASSCTTHGIDLVNHTSHSLVHVGELISSSIPFSSKLILEPPSFSHEVRWQSCHGSFIHTSEYFPSEVRVCDSSYEGGNIHLLSFSDWLCLAWLLPKVPLPELLILKKLKLHIFWQVS